MGRDDHVETAEASLEASGDVMIERIGYVARIWLSHPPNNHLSTDLLAALADAFEAVDDDAGCRVLVLASKGRVFCGGADLVGPDALAGPSQSGGIGPFYRQAERLFRSRKPVVAQIQGSAVGAGLGLALVADFRVAGPHARFAANFVKLGFHAGFAISHTLPRLIGAQRASMMLQTGRRIRAEEALALGLIDALTTDAGLPDAALALAAEIAANAPLAVQSTRATLRAGLADAVAAQTRHELAEQDRLMRTADFREGLQAVQERRDGAFIGA